MRKLTLLAAGAFAAISGPALATQPVNAPTLHGFCSVANACPENVSHTNSPTSVNPPAFGFSSGGHSESGILLLEILVPNVIQPSSFTLTSFTPNGFLGNSTVTATLFDANGALPGTPAWSTGQLDTYLGITASPTNPIGSYLPVAQGYQAGASGFFVYQAIIGTAQNPITLPSNGSAADSYLMQLGQSLIQGSFVLAFLDQSGNYGATANSGAILEIGAPPPPSVPEPATWAMMLAGFGVTGFAIRRSRRGKRLLAQIA
jgi:hypothetical protein